MSWVKSLSYSGEDVFDEDADDISLQTKEWKYNMEKRVKDGFVDGIDAGKEASLQIGFNLGYQEGAAQTLAIGRLKGIVSAIQCWCQMERPESPAPASVTGLLRRVARHEDALMEGMRQALENPPPSVSDVSETMEDLGVDRRDDLDCGGDGGCKGGAGDCCKRGGDAERPGKPRPASRGSCSGLEESIEQLLQSCMDVVEELGLPQELTLHLQQLKSSVNLV